MVAVYVWNIVNHAVCKLFLGRGSNTEANFLYESLVTISMYYIVSDLSLFLHAVKCVSLCVCFFKLGSSFHHLKFR